MSLGVFSHYFYGGTSSVPITTTTYGQIEGVVEYSRSGRSYYAFKGIPYAKPPTRDLRFRDPQAPDKWKGVKHTKTNPIFCVQLMTILFPPVKNLLPPVGSEDCLYLSVATPSLNPKAKRPVLVYLHGGAFVLLGGPSIYTPKYLMDSEDLVVVMANYRLSTLGFLSFEDDVLPGNMGLKDQNFALRWVQENIKNFGGDPNRVTIMGESAGAASVHYHSLSPMSQGLFHQIIPLSGSAFACWAYSYPGDARIQSLKYAKQLGCNGDNSSIIVDCLRRVPANRLIQTTSNFFGLWDLEPDRNLGPVFEKKRPGSFAPSSTKKWKPVEVPMLIGETNGEGLLKTITYKSPLRPKKWKWINRHWKNILPFSLRFLYTPNHQEVAEKLKKYFFAGKNDLDDSDIKNFTNMYSVIGMTSPVLHMAETAKNTVYYFKFNYLGDFSPASLIADPNFPKTTFHAEFLFYIMNVIIMPAWRGQDLQVSKTLTKMIANFVIHGDPTPDTKLWEPWTKNGYESLVIDNDGTRMVAEGLPPDVRFFRSLCAFRRFFDCDV